MSHFGRSGPPDIKDTFSLLVLNISFRTSPDDLYPLFDKYGKVVDVFIPRDRRTGDSRGFAFVRYKYADEAQKAVDKLDGIKVDGRDIMVQFAKYGPNAEPVKKGRVTEVFPRSRGRSRSRSPRPRYQDDHRGKDYRRRNYSPSHGRYERRIHRDSEREYRRRSRSRSMSPDYNRGRGKAVYDSDRNRYKSRSDESMSPRRRNSSPKRSRSPDSSPHRRSPHRRSRDGKSPRNDGRGKDMHDNVRKRYRSRSLESGSPAKHSPTPKRSQSPDSPNRRSAHRRSRDEHSPQNRNCDKSLYDNDRKRHKSRSCESSASPVRRSPTPKRSISPDCPNKRSPNRRSHDHVRVPRSPLESASPPRCSTPRKKSLSPDGNSSPLHGRRSSRRSHSASPIDNGHSPQSSCKLLLLRLEI